MLRPSAPLTGFSESARLTNLLFLCSRNRLRSPTAERVFADRPSPSLLRLREKVPPEKGADEGLRCGQTLSAPGKTTTSSTL
jgi:hypothetical protein